MQVRESSFEATIDDIYKTQTDIVLKDLLRGLYRKILEIDSVYYLRQFCNLSTFQFRFNDPECWQFSLSPFMPTEIKKVKEIDFLFDIVQRRIMK